MIYGRVGSEELGENYNTLTLILAGDLNVNLASQDGQLLEQSEYLFGVEAPCYDPSRSPIDLPAPSILTILAIIAGISIDRLESARILRISLVINFDPPVPKRPVHLMCPVPEMSLNRH
ncbi:hypothetical protein TNCV_1892041 [Trichonephila clavipes]|nr:hypothetical protein TNCV_1892041 [Trichonephila clavipes]